MNVLPAPLVEPNIIQEIYIDGIACIEQIGPNLKLSFFTFYRPTGSQPHEWERHVVARFVMPKAAVAAASMQAMVASDTGVFMEATH